MKEYIDVPKVVYLSFLSWANDNIDGCHYVPIPVSDRTAIKDGNGNMIAYRNLAYEETFHIEKKALDMWSEG